MEVANGNHTSDAYLLSSKLIAIVNVVRGSYHEQHREIAGTLYGMFLEKLEDKVKHLMRYRHSTHRRRRSSISFPWQESRTLPSKSEKLAIGSDSRPTIILSVVVE